MAGKGDRSGGKGITIIKKEEVIEGGHHGGAWKVAYADFVTAMMAFFLLMWLLNATTEDQRKGLADYFSPNNELSHASSGTGQPFGGHTAFDEGALVSDRGSVEITTGTRPRIERTKDGNDPVYTEYHMAKSGEGLGQGPVPDDPDADDAPNEQAPGQGGRNAIIGPDGVANGSATVRHDAASASQDGAAPSAAASTSGKTGERSGTGDAASRQREEKAAFELAARQIQEAVRADPALAELAKQLAIDMTPEGLRIQIMDEVKSPMFQTGSSAPNDRARLLIQKVVPVLSKLSQPISIAGHTDSAPFPGPERTNWELSAERANATRRLLVDGGLPEARIRSVTGHADRDPLLPADKTAAANRRIAIVVLRAEPGNPPVPVEAGP